MIPTYETAEGHYNQMARLIGNGDITGPDGAVGYLSKVMYDEYTRGYAAAEEYYIKHYRTLIANTEIKDSEGA